MNRPERLLTIPIAISVLVFLALAGSGEFLAVKMMADGSAHRAVRETAVLCPVAVGDKRP